MDSGTAVRELEERLADFAGVKHAVSCANGADALSLVLRAWQIGPGDAVFVPAFTFAASAEVVTLAGASPVFVDVLDGTYNIDPASLEQAIAMVRHDGSLTPCQRRLDSRLVWRSKSRPVMAHRDDQQRAPIGALC